MRSLIPLGRLVTVLAVAGLSVVGTGALSAQAAVGAPTETSSLSVVHGIRGLVADVWLDGEQVLSGFGEQRTAGPVTLTGAAHRLAVYRTGTTTDPVVDSTITLTPGASETLALGLDSDGDPFVYTYDDSLPETAATGASLVVRNIAAVPSVDVRVDGDPIGAVTPGSQTVHPVAAGDHSVMLLGSQGITVLAPQTVPVQNGEARVIYLIGSGQSADLAWIATSVQPRGATPALVQTGDSGLAADRSGVSPLPAAALVAAGVVLLVGAASGRRRSTVTVSGRSPA